MDYSSEIPRDVPNPSESEPQICGQEERMDLPLTSTSKSLPIMPLKSKAISERNDVVLDDQGVLPSARKPLDSIQSIYLFVQLLCSRVTEYNQRLVDLKVEFETLSMNPSLETLPDEELVNILQACKNIILDEKKNVNPDIVEIQEALEAISGKHHLPIDVDHELIDLLRLLGLGTSFQLILAEQKAQTSLFEEIKSISIAISKKLHFRSSAVKQILCELQSKNEFVEEMSIEKCQSMILDLMARSVNELKE